MWTKILIFLIVFFIVANPATFKIMRKLLGAWVASAEGLATPAGLVLHSVVFVGLAILIPKYLLNNSYYEDEEYEDEEYEEEDEYEEEEFAEMKKTSYKCPVKGEYYSKAAGGCKKRPICKCNEYFSGSAEACKPRTGCIN